LLIVKCLGAKYLVVTFEFLDHRFRHERCKVAASVAAIFVGQVFGEADQGLLQEVGGKVFVVEQRPQLSEI
jgi:hypothetical protein